MCSRALRTDYAIPCSHARCRHAWRSAVAALRLSADLATNPCHLVVASIARARTRHRPSHDTRPLLWGFNFLPGQTVDPACQQHALQSTPGAQHQHDKAHYVCRLEHENGDWHVCSVLELADVESLKLAGPSIWDCVRRSMDVNMRAKVYQPRTVPESDFQLPILGGEPMVRWIFLQVCSVMCSAYKRVLNSSSSLLFFFLSLIFKKFHVTPCA